MVTVSDNQQVPLEERAYLEFARRKGFSTKTDADGRPSLRGTKLFEGFSDAYLRNPHKELDLKRFGLSYQHEYDAGYNGGTFAWLCGDSYFRRDEKPETKDIFSL